MASWLITGGAGFLGRGLVRALLGSATPPERICVYSRGEHGQAQMRERIQDPGARLRWMIGDVRDLQRLRWAMADIDVVIHAAALKRIEVGKYAPTEMVLTNVFGTMNLVDAAAYCGVKSVVGVSSDKAWKPVSPYGQTKALGECLLLAGDIERRGPRYAICRYGNVAGSTGSVIPKWRAILRAFDTVPVTDPECTRFWMTRQEAVELVLSTVDTMTGGELRTPTLPAYRLGDLAAAMGARMTITGLPAHEKAHEGMGDGDTSDKAYRMTVAELKQELKYV